MSVRPMLPRELEAAVSVWRAVNVARGAPHGAERTARIRGKLSAADALAFVALGPEIVGMALAEPGRFDDGAGDLDPTLLHISMVFVHPAAQGVGVGSSLVLHVLDAARSLGYQRAGVWTYSDNTSARRLYESIGMATTGKTARVLTRTQIQYGCLLNRPKSNASGAPPVMKLATIHFDGGGQSPGPVTAACTVELSDGSFDQAVKRFDQGTHNTAEWQALILGLRLARKHGERHVVVKGDSTLVVKQVNREWKTKNPALLPLRTQAEELLAQFESWSVEWIPRNENRRADELGRA